MKLKPFEEWVGSFLKDGYEVHSYVAIRSDEEYRTGYESKDENLIIKLPFREDGINKPAVEDILDHSGLGKPAYYSWRSRSGCTFCFFQRKIEWVGLLERHPEAFEEAKNYEKQALDGNSPFTWSQNESLEELSRPERIQEIKLDYEKRKQRFEKKMKRQKHPLQPEKTVVDLDDLYGKSKVCLACHK